MLTVPEAARRTKRDPETVRRWIRSGRLKATKIVTQHLIDEDELAGLTQMKASSSSSIRCWVPILVALSRPDLIQRRTVSGSRLVRRAASGTVNIVALYYNNSGSRVPQRRR